MRWIKKMIYTFLSGLNELYHHAKFGEDRTTRTGCRCENVVFVFCLFVMLRVGWAIRWSGVYFEQLLCLFMGRFSFHFHPFSEVIALSEPLDNSYFRRQVTPPFQRNCGQNCEKSKKKSAEQFMRTTLYRQLRELKKIPPQQFGSRIQMCTYIKNLQRKFSKMHKIGR